MAAVPLEIDPLFFFLHWVLKIPAARIGSGFFLFLRLCGIFSCFQNCRMFGFTVAAFVVEVYSILGAVCKANPFRNYARVILFQKRTEEEVALCALGIQSVGLFLGIAFIFASVSMGEVLPLPIHAFCITTSFLVLLTTEVLLPMAISTHTETEQILEKGRKELIGKGNVSYWKRKLGSYMPYRLYGGTPWPRYNFYYYHKTTKIAYYGLLAEFSVDAVLGIPAILGQDGVLF